MNFYEKKESSKTRKCLLGEKKRIHVDRFVREFRELCFRVQFESLMRGISPGFPSASIPVLPDPESVFDLSQGPPIVCERGLRVSWHHLL